MKRGFFILPLVILSTRSLQHWVEATGRGLLCGMICGILDGGKAMEEISKS